MDAVRYRKVVLFQNPESGVAESRAAPADQGAFGND